MKLLENRENHASLIAGDQGYILGPVAGGILENQGLLLLVPPEEHHMEDHLHGYQSVYLTKSRF